MSGTVDAKAQWLQRVLGLTIPTEAPPSAPDAGQVLARFRTAKQGWQAAVEQVDGQIDALAKYLRASGDDDMAKIADSGLMTVTGGFRTKMTAALMDLGDGDVGKLRKNGGKAAGFAEKLRGQIEGDARVAACDDNEFGVAVSIAATLGAALGKLADALRDATKA